MPGCRTHWTITSDTVSTVGDGDGDGDAVDVLDVLDVASVADCVDECDGHQSCLGVDVNETAKPLVSCRFYLGTAGFETLGRKPAPGIVQFVADRCPEDGT